MVALVVIKTVRRQVGIDTPAPDVEAEAVTASGASLAELLLQPSCGHEVAGDPSAVAQVLLLVVLHLLVQVAVEGFLVPWLLRVEQDGLEEADVFQLRGSGDRRVDPFPRDEVEGRVEDAGFVVDGRAQEGVAGSAVSAF